jgi:hypothetical protein
VTETLVQATPVQQWRMKKAVQISVALFLAWVAASIGIRVIAILFFVDNNSEISLPVVSVMAAIAVAIWVYKGAWPFQGAAE